MPAPLVKTAHPGIFRRGRRYVVVYRVNGRQRRETTRTLDEARRLKRAREADRDRGDYQAQLRLTFREYAAEWIDRYHGRGRRGFREHTRADYRRDLERYAFEHFDDRLRVVDMTPRDVAKFVAWLCDAKAQGARAASERRKEEALRLDVPIADVPLPTAKPVRLADATVRRIVSPLRACMGSAVHEGVIRHNPTLGLALPYRPNVDDEPEQAKALTREQLATFLAVVHPSHRPLFSLLASTGLRISEALALQWRHVQLDGSRPHVKVRRAHVRGDLGPPKSKHGRRDVPLHPDLVVDLRRHRRDSEWPGDDDLVFPAANGAVLDPDNFRKRVLRPAAEEADVAWAGYHAFRHSCASMLFERGANAVQVQRWLGHSSAAFTLQRYVHLLADDLGQPLDLAAELGAGCGGYHPEGVVTVAFQ